MLRLWAFDAFVDEALRGTHDPSSTVARRTPTNGLTLGTYNRNIRASQRVKGLRSKLCPAIRDPFAAACAKMKALPGFRLMGGL